MATEPSDKATEATDSATRLTILCTPALVDGLDRAVEEEQPYNPAANRSVIVRRLIKAFLEARVEEPTENPASVP